MRTQFLAMTLLLACRQPATDAGPRGASERVASAPLPHERAAPSWIAVRVTAPTDAPDELAAAAIVIEHAIARGPVSHLWTTIASRQATCWVALDVDDPTARALELRVAINEVSAQLPSALDPPQIEAHPRGESMTWLHVEGERQTAGALSAIAARARVRVQNIAGIREATRCGPERRTVIEIDRTRAAAFGIAPQRLVELLASSDGLGARRFDDAALAPAGLFARAGVGAEAASQLATVREHFETTCEAPGGGVALRLRVLAEHVDGLDAALASVRGELPAGVQLRLEPAAIAPREALAVVAEDPAQRDRVADAAAAWATRTLGVSVDRSQEAAIETFVVTPDREIAARLGVRIDAIAAAVELSTTRGQLLGVRDDEEHTEVALRVGDGGPDAMAAVTVTAADGQQVPLRQLATITPTATRSQQRCDGRPCTLLTAAVELAGLDLEAARRELALGPEVSLLRLPLPPTD